MLNEAEPRTDNIRKKKEEISEFIKSEGLSVSENIVLEMLVRLKMHNLVAKMKPLLFSDRITAIVRREASKFCG